jgi:hypothetical protein
LICVIGLFVAIAIPNRIPDGRGGPTFACINKLREIDAAKNAWVYEHHSANGDIVTVNQLTNYLIHGLMPKCPSGGTYKIGKIGEFPTCSFHGNVLQWSFTNTTGKPLK